MSDGGQGQEVADAHMSCSSAAVLHVLEVEVRDNPSVHRDLWLSPYRCSS